MPPKARSEAPAEPWRSFLSELDALLDQSGDLHCIGGFVISQYYGFARETADLDLDRGADAVGGNGLFASSIDNFLRDGLITRTTGSPSKPEAD